jgi:hypothetical protein
MWCVTCENVNIWLRNADLVWCISRIGKLKGVDISHLPFLFQDLSIGPNISDLRNLTLDYEPPFKTKYLHSPCPFSYISFEIYIVFIWTIKWMCVAKLVWSSFSVLRPASFTNIDFLCVVLHCSITTLEAGFKVFDPYWPYFISSIWMVGFL